MAENSCKKKRAEKRPTHQRYWVSGRLPARKISALVLSGYEPAAATQKWEDTRKRLPGGAGGKAIMNYPLIEKRARVAAARRQRRQSKGGAR